MKEIKFLLKGLAVLFLIVSGFGLLVLIYFVMNNSEMELDLPKELRSSKKKIAIRSKKYEVRSMKGGGSQLKAHSSKPIAHSPQPTAYGLQLTARQKDLLKIIQGKQNTSMTDLKSKISGVTERTLRRDLAILVQKKLITQSGKTRNMTYRVV